VSDAAASLGVLDQLTGVYWGFDAFGCLLPDQPWRRLRRTNQKSWAHGMAGFARGLLLPWLDVIDEQLLRGIV
jgi:hypothetical protein